MAACNIRTPTAEMRGLQNQKDISFITALLTKHAEKHKLRLCVHKVEIINAKTKGYSRGFHSALITPGGENSPTPSSNEHTTGVYTCSFGYRNPHTHTHTHTQ